jgi:hypothetical protein
LPSTPGAVPGAGGCIAVGSGGGMGMDVAVSAIAIYCLVDEAATIEKTCTVRKWMALDDELRVGICVFVKSSVVDVCRKLGRGGIASARQVKAIARIKC